MAYTYSFADNVVYGAEDINAVVNRFVTGGVAEVFYNGTSYNTSDLNAITEYIATYGVRSGVSNTLRVVSDGESTVKILSGSAFMHDGAYVEVDSDGVSLDYLSGQVNYVYIKNNLDETNSIDFVCSLAEESGDVVPLAVINADGSITDARVYCKGKLAGYQSEFNQTKIIDVPYSITADEKGASQTVRIDLEGISYSKLVNVTSVLSSGYGAGVGYCDLNDDIYYSYCEAYYQNYELLTDRLRIYSHSTKAGDDIVDAVFRLDGSELICTFTAYYGRNSNSGETRTFSGTAKFLIC